MCVGVLKPKDGASADRLGDLNEQLSLDVHSKKNNISKADICLAQMTMHCFTSQLRNVGHTIEKGTKILPPLNPWCWFKCIFPSRHMHDKGRVAI